MCSVSRPKARTNTWMYIVDWICMIHDCTSTGLPWSPLKKSGIFGDICILCWQKNDIFFFFFFFFSLFFGCVSFGCPGSTWPIDWLRTYEILSWISLFARPLRILMTSSRQVTPEFRCWPATGWHHPIGSQPSSDQNIGLDSHSRSNIWQMWSFDIYFGMYYIILYKYKSCCPVIPGWILGRNTLLGMGWAAFGASSLSSLGSCVCFFWGGYVHLHIQKRMHI